MAFQMKADRKPGTEAPPLEKSFRRQQHRAVAEVLPWAIGGQHRCNGRTRDVFQLPLTWLRASDSCWMKASCLVLSPAPSPSSQPSSSLATKILKFQQLLFQPSNFQRFHIFSGISPKFLALTPGKLIIFQRAHLSPNHALVLLDSIQVPAPEIWEPSTPSSVFI